MGLAAHESSVSLQRIQGPIDLFSERNTVKSIGHGLAEVFGTTTCISRHGKSVWLAGNWLSVSKQCPQCRYRAHPEPP